jgi:hypothetical protein
LWFAAIYGSYDPLGGASSRKSMTS